MAAMAFVELVPGECVETLYNHSNRSFQTNFKIILLFELIQIHRQFKQIWCTHIKDLCIIYVFSWFMQEMVGHRIVNFHRFIVLYFR